MGPSETEAHPVATALGAASFLAFVAFAYAGVLYFAASLAGFTYPFLALFILFILFNLPPGLRSADGPSAMRFENRLEAMETIAEFYARCRRNPRLRGWPASAFAWWFAVSQILKREFVVTWLFGCLFVGVLKPELNSREFILLVAIVAIVGLPFSLFESYRTGRLRLVALSIRERYDLCRRLLDSTNGDSRREP